MGRGNLLTAKAMDEAQRQVVIDEEHLRLLRVGPVLTGGPNGVFVAELVIRWADDKATHE